MLLPDAHPTPRPTTAARHPNVQENPRATQISVRSVSKSYNGRLVLDAVTCTLTTGERTGIVGENGSGKTTLLRLLAGTEQPDSGTLTVHADGGIGHLPQDGTCPPTTPSSRPSTTR